jgi:predicted peroxiredoxin
MKDERAILYVQTSDTPERQYSPLVLAQTAKHMDLAPRLYYMGQGLRILVPGVAESIQVGSFPPLDQMLRATMDLGVEVLVCQASKQVFGWDEVQLIDGVRIAGAATLNDMALDSGATMWF